jgi:hypothetical protein
VGPRQNKKEKSLHCSLYALVRKDRSSTCAAVFYSLGANRIEESISRIELLGSVPVVLESNHTSFSLSHGSVLEHTGVALISESVN